MNKRRRHKAKRRRRLRKLFRSFRVVGVEEIRMPHSDYVVGGLKRVGTIVGRWDDNEAVNELFKRFFK